MTPPDKTIAVLSSGRGTNLQALIEASRRGEIPGRIGVVFSNNPACGALALARKAGISCASRDHRDCSSPEDLDQAVVEALKPHAPDWVCLAGYLRKITPVLLGHYPGRILNVHPALLPAFGGKGYYGLKVHQVFEIAAKHKVPVIGQGGIVTAEDALEFIIAGATTVGVGTALFYDPLACQAINEGIARYMTRHQLTSLASLTGSLEL